MEERGKGEEEGKENRRKRRQKRRGVWRGRMFDWRFLQTQFTMSGDIKDGGVEK